LAKLLYRMRVAPSTMWFLIASVLVVAFGAVLRWVHMGDAFWLDEVWVVAHIDGFDPWQNYVPPLFTFALRTVDGLFGVGERSLHSPAFAAGVLTCATPLLLLPLIHDTLGKTGVFIWTVLLTFSSPLIFYAAQVKHYTVDALASTVILCLFMYVSREPMRPKRWIAFTVVSLGAVMLLYAPIFVAAATCLAFGILLLPPRSGPAGRGLRYAAVAHGLIFAGFVIAYFGYLRLDLPSGGNEALKAYWRRRFWDGSVGWAVWSTRQWAGNMLNLTRLFMHLGGLAVAAWLVHDLRAMWRRKVALIVAALGPGLLALCASFPRLYPYGEVRLMVYAAPGALLLLAAAFTGLLRARTRYVTAPVLVPLLLLFLYNGAVANTYNFYMGSYDMRPVFDYVARNHRSGEPIVLPEALCRPFVYYHPQLKGDAFQSEKLAKEETSRIQDARAFWTVRKGAPPETVAREGRRSVDSILRHRDTYVFRTLRRGDATPGR